VTCYVRAVAQFAKHFNQSPDHLGPDQIRSWQLDAQVNPESRYAEI